MRKMSFYIYILKTREINFFKKMIKGLYTALITPFTKDGKIDYESFEKIIEFQIESRVDGVVVAGTTGESPTLSHKENIEIIKKAIEIIDGRIKIIAGTGSNSTDEAVFMTKEAEKLGADYSLLVCPYYNKPTQNGLFLHYEKISKSCPKINHILYDVPSRTGVSLATETIIELSRIENIVSLKSATNSLEQVKSLQGNLPKNFSILSGDDDLTVEIMKLGGSGVISVASNYKPKELRKIIDLSLERKFSEASDEANKIENFFKVCFCESNPIPIKTIMHEAGFCEEIFRLPLCKISDNNRKLIKNFL